MIREVAVVVPVADEEQLLGSCLESICAAADVLSDDRPATTVRIVVVLDGCTDASAEVAASFPTERLAISSRSVGAARAAGTSFATATSVRAATHWVATTDADSCVPADWLQTMLDLADDGAHLVLGTVCPVGPIDPARSSAFWTAYQPTDGHPHVHGANLGVRLDWYRRAGGWPALATGEDHALARHVIAAGATVVRTGRIPVLTSAREFSRVPHGFATYLRDQLRPDGRAS